MEIALRPREDRRPESLGGRVFEDLWRVRGVMAKNSLPDDPTERRRRSRLYTLRAKDGLGLLDTRTFDAKHEAEASGDLG